MKTEFFKYLLILVLIFILAAVLRIPFLSKLPPALYSDEVSQGYNAYSLLKTGHDEYGVKFPVSFRSFGDWKPPLQTYLMIPTIFIFGLNPLAVRLSTAILGTFTIPLIYFLFIEIINTFVKDPVILRNRKQFALLGALALAISPWHILQSRSSMLVAVTLFFLVLSLWLLLKGLYKKIYLIPGSLFMSLSIYGYYGLRAIAPVIVLLALIYFRKKIITAKRFILISFIGTVIILFPLLGAFFQQPDVIFGRAKTVSIFYSEGVNLRLNELLLHDYINGAQFSRLFHNKLFEYTNEVLSKYAEHFDPKFLFLSGDGFDPFQLPNMGILYFTDILLLCLGFVYLAKNDRKLLLLILVWFWISVLPAALTYVTPASNRSLNAIISYIFLGNCAWLAIKKYKSRLLATVLLPIFIATNCLFFMNNYFVLIPNTKAHWWHYGYKEMFTYLESDQKDADMITINGQTTVSYIFLLFYLKIPPDQIAQKIKRDLKDDAFGFEHVASFDRYHFPRSFSWDSDREKLIPGSLYVTWRKAPDQKGLELLKSINYPSGEVAYSVYKVQE